MPSTSWGFGLPVSQELGVEGSLGDSVEGCCRGGSDVHVRPLSSRHHNSGCAGALELRPGVCFEGPCSLGGSKLGRRRAGLVKQTSQTKSFTSRSANDNAFSAYACTMLLKTGRVWKGDPLLSRSGVRWVGWQQLERVVSSPREPPPYLAGRTSSANVVQPKSAVQPRTNRRINWWPPASLAKVYRWKDLAQPPSNPSQAMHIRYK